MDTRTKEPKLSVLEDAVVADAAAVAHIEDDVQDIDPAAYLAEDDSDVRGKVKIQTKAGPRMLAIAALTEEEIAKCQRGANKPISRTQTKFDGNLFKQLVVAVSLSKVSGTVVMPDHLAKKLGGSITKIADEITKLSGYGDEKDPETDQILGFTG